MHVRKNFFCHRIFKKIYILHNYTTPHYIYYNIQHNTTTWHHSNTLAKLHIIQLHYNTLKLQHPPLLFGHKTHRKYCNPLHRICWHYWFALGVTCSNHSLLYWCNQGGILPRWKIAHCQLTKGPLQGLHGCGQTFYLT